MKLTRWITTLGAAIGLAGLCGCAVVRQTRTENEPGFGEAKPTGMPAETVKHFEEVYPPDGWPAATKKTLAIGPIVVEREALLLLSDADSATAGAEVESGETRIALSVENRTGQPRMLATARYNDEVRAILLEAIAASPAFRVLAPPGKDPPAPGGAESNIDALRKRGAHYYLTGNLVEAEPDGKTLRLYLQILDLGTHRIECATSVEGADLRETARRGAEQLMARIRN